MPETAHDAAAVNSVVSVQEAAARLGVHPSTIYEGIRRGEIPVIQLGSRKIIPRPAFEQLLAGDTSGREVDRREIAATVRLAVRAELRSLFTGGRDDT